MFSFRVFLSKKMRFSNDNPISRMAWNRVNKLIAGGYADGKVSLFVVTPSREQPGSVQVETSAVLDAHKKKISTLTWSEDGRFLASGDVSGKIAFFKRVDKGWKSHVVNSSVAACVNSLAFSKDSTTAAITYADKTLACVNFDGDLKWSIEVRYEIEYAEWSPRSNESQVLLCGTSYGEIKIYNSKGVEIGTVPTPCLQKSKTEPKLAGIEWHRKAEYGLLIAYRGGNVQLMRNENDTQPTIITMDIEISAVSWFKNGSAFVIAGTKPSGRSVAIFFTNHGDTIRELELQGKDIHAISLDPTDTSLAIACDDLFCLAQIVPSITWAYTASTLLYGYSKSNDDTYTAVFFNKKSREKHVQTQRKLTTISGDAGHFALTTTTGIDESMLTITNTIGVTLCSCVIPIVPFISSSAPKCAAVASTKRIYVWRYEEEESPQFLEYQDVITSILLREKCIYISVNTDIIVLDIPNLKEIASYKVGFQCETIGVNSDGSILSLIDQFGTLQFFSTIDNRIVGPVCKEVWNASWASDNPSQFAALERQKLIVYNNLEPDDPVPCLSHIAEFNDLEITCVDLIWLLKDPMKPSLRFFRSYPTKQLRQIRKMLSGRPETTIEDIFQFAKTEARPKLWDELAETAMLEMNFGLAERCYLETTNYRGLQFVKRVRAVKDAKVQRAQVLSYLGRFDEAESIFLSMDRIDLAIEMRTSVGDFHHVIKLIRSSTNDDESAANAFTAVGDEYCEDARWIEASKAYAQARNDEKLMKAFFLAGDFHGLERLTGSLPQSSPLLEEIGKMFVTIGAVDDAVAAFTSAGNITAAIDACARMNHWKPALHLAGKGKIEEIKERMINYARQLIDNGQRAAAVDFYVRAGLNVEAAKLLLNEGDSILAQNSDYVSAKMCYIFAGLQLEQHRRGAFDGGATADERLEGLMKEDEITTSGLHREIWRKAEGIHYLLLTSRLIESHRWKDALFSACRLFDDYSDIVGETRAAAILAICGYKTRYFGQCSRAMTTLEHSDEIQPHIREKYEDLSIDFFTRNAPNDPSHVGAVSCPKCSQMVSMLHSQCSNCGEKMRVCTYTGRLIDGNDFWECRYCHHCVLYSIVDELPVCPLCHHVVAP